MKEDEKEEIKVDTSKSQTIRCRCGKMFAACVNGHQDEDFILDVHNYISKYGCTSTLETSKNMSFDTCECPNMDGSLKGQTKLEF